MIAQESWTPLEGSLAEVLAREPGMHPRRGEPFPALAAGRIPAVILRQAFPREQCRAVVERLYERGGIVERTGAFHEYAAEHGVERIRIELGPGDFYVFNTRNIHEVPYIQGHTPRIVLATFLG